MEFFASLMRLMVALGVVFGLLFGLRWYLLRRTSALASAPTSLLRIRERVWLSGRTQVALLDVGEDSFLVCTTDHAVQVTPLAKLPSLTSTGHTDVPSFAAHLEQMITFLRQGGKK